MATPPQLDRITVAEATQRYLVSLERSVLAGSLSHTTQATYRRDLTEFSRLALPHTILDDLSSEDLDDIVLTYASEPDRRYTSTSQPDKPGTHGGRSPSTQARFRHSISRFFAHAERHGWIQHNPVPDMSVKPRARGDIPPARKALSQESATALLKVPTLDTSLSLRDMAIIRILMEVGLRVSELCALNASDIEINDDVPWLVIRHGKGGKHRDVPLSPATYQAIHLYQESSRPQPPPTDSPERKRDAAHALFITFRGRRMQPRDVQNMMNRATDALPAEVRRKCTPHGLRHTAATLLLTSGAADVKTVQRILGHESLATTGMYLDEVREEMVKAIAIHPVTGDGLSTES